MAGLSGNAAALAEECLEDSGLLDSKGNIKQDSKLVLIVTDDGTLTAEGTVFLTSIDPVPAVSVETTYCAPHFLNVMILWSFIKHHVTA